MDNLPLFNAAEARKLRDEGMISCATYDHHREDWLRKAQEIARHLAMKHGETNSDEVQAICPRPANVPPNATGSLWKGSDWIRLGDMPTAKTTGHARRIGRWALKQ